MWGWLKDAQTIVFCMRNKGTLVANETRCTFKAISSLKPSLLDPKGDHP